MKSPFHNTSGSSDDRVTLLANVALLHYEKGLTQEQISNMMGVSCSKISRLLKEAREKGGWRFG